jgi:hypothetical protein
VRYGGAIAAIPENSPQIYIHAYVHTHTIPCIRAYIEYIHIQGAQKVSVHLMITVQKNTQK